MSSEVWQNQKLASITKKIGSGSTPRGGSGAYKEVGLPFIRSQNVYNCVFNPDGLVYIDDEQAKKLANVELEQDDVLLNITGDSVARCTKVPKEYVGGRVNQHVAIIRVDDNILDSNFLKYSLVNSRMQKYLLSLASSGGTRAALTKAMIENIEICLPPLDNQKAIANILSSLDDKIEVNNAINKKIEEMAQAIFKQWFVDFEFPNEEGKPYKSSGGAMVESELGMIPEGWEINKLSDVLTIKHGYAFKSKDFSDEKTSLLILTPGNFKVGGGFKSEKFKYLTEGTTFPEEYILNSKDLIITMTDLSKDGDTLGYPAFIPRSKNEKYLHNQRLGKVRMKQDFSKYYLYILMCSNRYRGHILGTSTGTTVKHTAPKRVEEFKFVKPVSIILTKFHNVIQHMYDSIEERDFENIKLSIIRDTLLPKLMSGEVRVPLNKE